MAARSPTTIRFCTGTGNWSPSRPAPPTSAYSTTPRFSSSNDVSSHRSARSSAAATSSRRAPPSSMAPSSTCARFCDRNRPWVRLLLEFTDMSRNRERTGRAPSSRRMSRSRSCLLIISPEGCRVVGGDPLQGRKAGVARREPAPCPRLDHGGMIPPRVTPGAAARHRPRGEPMPDLDHRAYWEGAFTWEAYLADEVHKLRPLWEGVWRKSAIAPDAARQAVRLGGPWRLLVISED